MGTGWRAVNVTAPVQEVIDRPDWAGPLALVSENNDGLVSFRAYDNGANIWYLTITYTTTGAAEKALAGTVAAEATLTGALSVSHTLAGTVAATATLTGTLTVGTGTIIPLVAHIRRMMGGQ